MAFGDGASSVASPNAKRQTGPSRRYEPGQAVDDAGADAERDQEEELRRKTSTPVREREREREEGRGIFENSHRGQAFEGDEGRVDEGHDDEDELWFRHLGEGRPIVRRGASRRFISRWFGSLGSRWWWSPGDRAARPIDRRRRGPDDRSALLDP